MNFERAITTGTGDHFLTACHCSAGITVTVSVRADHAASVRELQGETPEAQGESIPDEHLQAIQQALSSEVLALLREAHLRLLACRAEAALRSLRGEAAIVAPAIGGAQ